MNLDVPRTKVAGLIQHFAPASKRGSPSFSIATMVRIHFIPHWFDLPDPAME
jgi:transposase, IS5 family